MRVLVTGGNGFLGGEICRQLRARGDGVRSVSRRAAPALAAMGVESLQGDLSVPADAARAVAGVDAVIHVAALAGVAGAWSLYQSANIDATANVLAACRAAGVARLVYTSTPSVVHGGGDVEGLDESAPYAAHFETHYPATKAEAERMVLAAHGPDLMTVALRPHLIWGPGDNHLVPRIVARARAGRLRLIGGPPKKVDATYIDNAAWAHVLALDKLAPGAACGGRAYFIAQGEPLPMNELVNRILGAVGLPPVTKTVPPRVAWLAGAAMEGAWRLLGRQDEPLMTRFVARQLSTAHWYDLSAAKRDLGYEAQVPLDEGLARLGAWWKAHPDGV